MKGYCLFLGKSPRARTRGFFVTTMTTTAYTLKIKGLQDYNL